MSIHIGMATNEVNLCSLFPPALHCHMSSAIVEGSRINAIYYPDYRHSSGIQKLTTRRLSIFHRFGNVSTCNVPTVATSATRAARKQWRPDARPGRAILGWFNYWINHVICVIVHSGRMRPMIRSSLDCNSKGKLGFGQSRPWPLRGTPAEDCFVLTVIASIEEIRRYQSHCGGGSRTFSARVVAYVEYRGAYKLHNGTLFKRSS